MLGPRPLQYGHLSQRVRTAASAPAHRGAGGWAQPSLLGRRASTAAPNPPPRLNPWEQRHSSCRCAAGADPLQRGVHGRGAARSSDSTARAPDARGRGGQRAPSQLYGSREAWENGRGAPEQTRRQAPQRERVQLFQGGGGDDVAGDSEGGDSSGTAPAAALLTRQIMATRGWRDLQEVLTDRVPLLNAVHISAALHQLSRLVGGRGAGSLEPSAVRQVALMAEALLERGEEVARCVCVGGVSPARDDHTCIAAALCLIAEARAHASTWANGGVLEQSSSTCQVPSAHPVV